MLLLKTQASPFLRMLMDNKQRKQPNNNNHNDNNNYSLPHSRNCLVSKAKLPLLPWLLLLEQLKNNPFCFHWDKRDEEEEDEEAESAKDECKDECTGLSMLLDHLLGTFHSTAHANWTCLLEAVLQQQKQQRRTFTSMLLLLSKNCFPSFLLQASKSTCVSRLFHKQQQRREKKCLQNANSTNVSMFCCE